MKLAAALKAIGDIFNLPLYITKAQDALFYQGSPVTGLYTADVGPAASTGAVAHNGLGKFMFQVNAITAITVEGSLNGTNWFPAEIYLVNNSATKIPGVVAATTVGEIYALTDVFSEIRINNTGAATTQVAVRAVRQYS